MGNCMETYTLKPMEVQKEEEEERRRSGDDNSKGKNNGLRMKIVLTKEELKWLILQLNEKEGITMEQVLEEIERGRQKVEGWKPSLESIVEAPEILEIN